MIVESAEKGDVEIYGEYVGRIRAQQFVEAVSYTHLDVYKRQAWTRFIETYITDTANAQQSDV